MSILTKVKYNPKYKPNQLICGYGQIAIVTGWTVKSTVEKYLSVDDYAVIGNLYSPARGISFLIRNLLLNPHVKYLVILNATKEDKNAGSCQCLLDFFRNGFKKGLTESKKDVWVINSDVLGYIDYQIPKLILEKLRTNILFQEVNTIENLISMVEYYKIFNEEYQKTFGKISRICSEPLTFPDEEVISNIVTGDIYGHRVEGETIAETWVKILHRIKTTGDIRPTGYDGKWQEIINLMAVVKSEPIDCHFPTPNYLPIDREFLNSYKSQILDDSPYREGVKYTYGQRLRSWFKKDQIKQVIHKLIDEIDAASAVMSLWDVDDHEKGGSPCLNHIWLRVNNNKLSLTATFRSNDMFSAWVANAMGLRLLQQHIRDEIAFNSDYDLELGSLITISQSAHIYDDTWENVENLINTQYLKLANQETYTDPIGNYLIELVNNQIVVNQITLNGEIINVFEGRNPLKLIKQISLHSPSIQPYHIGYLGVELNKASQCLKNNIPYIQDS